MRPEHAVFAERGMTYKVALSPLGAGFLTGTIDTTTALDPKEPKLTNG